MRRCWVLLAVIAAIGLIGCGSSSPPLPSQSASADTTPVPSGWTANASLASADVIAVLEGRLDAYNRGDFAAAAAFWAENGVLIEYEGKTVLNQGREAIAKRLAGVYDFGIRMEPAGAPIQFGQIVAQPVRWLPTEPGGPDGPSMLVFVMNDSNEIAAEYVTFWAPG